MNGKSSNMKWVFLTILSLIWGSSFILMKHGLMGFAPAQLAAIRIGVAFLAMFPFVVNKLKTIPRESIKYIAVVGIIGSGIPAFLFATAQTRINSTLAGMLNALTPLFTMIVGSYFFKTKFNARQILGVGIGFIGAAGLIFLRFDGQGLSADFGYALLIVIATLFYGISVNTIKTYLSGVDSITITGVSLFFLGIPYLIFLLAGTDFISRLQNVPGAGLSLLFIVILGVMGTALSSVLYFQMVKISSPLFASVTTYFMPIVALGWGILDGEQLSFWHLVSMAAILGGVFLISGQSAVVKARAYMKDKTSGS